MVILMIDNSMKIGFFDSGIGGVTVLNDCVKLVNNFQYIYYSDSFNNPYGDKSKEKLFEIVDDVVTKLIDEGCRIIVIACNTASCVCSDYLRNKYKDIIFIAIEPAVKLVYDNGDGDNTLIMVTKGTRDSDKFHELYGKYNNNFYLLSCEGLADAIENNNMEIVDRYLMEYLGKYKGIVSSVVLGCTHYPLIKNNIRKVLGDVTFYDGSIGVAKRLLSVIKSNNFVGNDKFGIKFIDSANSEIKKRRFLEMMEGNYE